MVLIFADSLEQGVSRTVRALSLARQVALTCPEFLDVPWSSDAGMRVALAIWGNTQLEALEVEFPVNTLSEGVQPIIDAVAAHPSLSHVELKQLQTCPDAALWYGAMFNANARLTEIFALGAVMGDHGLEVLLGAVGDSTRVRGLHLCSNDLTGVGAAALVRHLAPCHLSAPGLSGLMSR